MDNGKVDDQLSRHIHLADTKQLCHMATRTNPMMVLIHAMDRKVMRIRVMILSRTRTHCLGRLTEVLPLLAAPP